MTFCSCLIKKCTHSTITHVAMVLKDPDFIQGYFYLQSLFENEKNLIYSDKCIEVQRSLDPEHLQDILKYQINYYKLKQHYFYPTPIIVCKLNDKYTIIDGQHRYESIKTLTNLYKQRDAFMVPVSIIRVETKDEIIEYFKIINMNKPIPSMILEDTTNWLQVSKGFEKYLYDI